ncbi:uncharacterized protein [Lepisosteus oculatus]|uniref:uncharacterized protein isoform X2 n=1 Tax=Lepisosteus oculatus TaxID=7918 RepID=UPI0037116F25
MEDDEEELDLLGEKLYTLLYPRHTEMAGKLTGMLLELPSSVIKEMLQDERMLSEGVEKALTALRQLADTGKTEPYVEDGTSISTDSQGDQLYELVDVYNTGYTEQITGMLLEQKKEDVQKLLSDPSLLEEKVTIALKSLEEQKQMESEASDSSESDVKERLGERLFDIVEQIDAAKCADITGMLLEMDPGTLQHVLRDRAMLEVAVQRAQSALMPRYSQSSSDTGTMSDTLGEQLHCFIISTSFRRHAERITDRLLRKVEEAASSIENEGRRH